MGFVPCSGGCAGQAGAAAAAGGGRGRGSQVPLPRALGTLTHEPGQRVCALNSAL